MCISEFNSLGVVKSQCGGEVFGTACLKPNSIVVSPCIGVTVCMYNGSVCHVWVWSLPTSVWSVKGTSTTVFVGWSLRWGISLRVLVPPIMICQKCTRRVAACILIIVIWVDCCQWDIANSINVLRWTVWSRQTRTVKIGWVVCITFACEGLFIWESPSINLAWIVPIKAICCAESCFKLWINRWRAASMWAWQIWTSTLTKSTVFSHTITLIFWPEAGCWDWLWNLVIHHSADINFKSLRPEIKFCLIVNPNRLRGTIDYSEFGIIDVLSSTHIIVVHDIDNLIRSSNSIR